MHRTRSEDLQNLAHAPGPDEPPERSECPGKPKAANAPSPRLDTLRAPGTCSRSPMQHTSYRRHTVAPPKIDRPRKGIIWKPSILIFGTLTIDAADPAHAPAVQGHAPKAEGTQPSHASKDREGRRRPRAREDPPTPRGAPIS